MEIGDIISDALTYPFSNIKALVIYVILGIIAGLVGGAGLVGILSGNFAGDALGIIGVVICVLIFFLIMGYELDIVKYGINKDSTAPSIEFGRQIGNALKLIVVGIVYYIIPVIIAAVLGFLLGNGILTNIISIIIIIVFALAQFMAKCRLAKTDSLGEALAFGEAIGDISRVGLAKLLITVIIIFVIVAIVTFIIMAVMNLNATIGGILLGIFAVYTVFFVNRATGLLYSEV